MITFLQNFSPLAQTLIATGFTWGLTALGAATIFLSCGFNRKVLDWMLGFAAGVMIAASYWSLLAPALEMAEGNTLPTWVPAVVGFLAGGVFLRSLDRVLPHLHLSAPTDADTEGLAVGVAFG